jgi:ribosomal protein S6
MIQNIGNEDAGLSYVRFYLSNDEIYDGSDTFLKEVSTGKKMKVGKIKNKKLKYKLPIDETASGKYVIAVIDADNTVTEAIESNNHVINGPISVFP